MSSPGASFFGHPRALATLFFTEMWERFTFYGMRALLVLFLVDAVASGGYGFDDKTATAIYGPDRKLLIWNRAYARLWQLDEGWLDFVRRRMSGDYGVDDFGFDPELTDKVFLALMRPL